MNNGAEDPADDAKELLWGFADRGEVVPYQGALSAAAAQAVDNWEFAAACTHPGARLGLVGDRDDWCHQCAITTGATRRWASATHKCARCGAISERPAVLYLVVLSELLVAAVAVCEMCDELTEKQLGRQNEGEENHE